MIADIIKELQAREHYGIGKHIEMAKGRDELTVSWSDLKKKIKRRWHLKK